MPNFEVGHNVLMARVRKLGSAPKLVTKWSGSWRVVSDGSSHVYNVQDIMTGKTKGFTSCGCVPMQICLLLWALRYRACSR